MRFLAGAMMDKNMKKIKFRYNENEYELSITENDWWIEDGPSDMSERMIAVCNEIALANGMTV